MDFEQEILDIEARIEELTSLNEQPGVQFDTEIATLRRELDTVKNRVYKKLSPWQTVQVARHNDRPLFRDYMGQAFTDVVELHGDRCFGDDHALIGGFATIGDRKVMLIGMEKGRSVDEKIKANFGMVNPEGYRKALRLMRLAEKYHLPIVCLVDTPAAYPGKEAEERGQAEAIARNITEMTTLEVPIVVVITGEGGSGGALGIAVGDSVLMLSNAIYSVIPPEGCAAILWRDADKAPEAAEALRITSDDLMKLGIIDEIVPEPVGGAHRDPTATIAATREAILKHLDRLAKLSTRKLLDRRFDKFTAIGRLNARK
jgi:acetyl-CoA carboxylase carboxyl transferase subunit alpha